MTASPAREVDPAAAGSCGHDHDQMRTLTAIRRLLSEGVGALSMREAAGVLARVSRSVLETEHAVAYLADDAGRIGEIVTANVDPAMARMLDQLLVGLDGDQVPLWRRRLQGEQHPVLMVDDALESDLIPVEVVTAIHLRSYVAFPILGGDGEVLGGVVCSHADRPRRWGRRTADTVRQLALEGSLIIENAVLRESNERRLAELTIRAQTDPLTGLANRSRLLDAIEDATETGRRARRTVGLVFLDLDDFKHVNDTHGHAAGDRVLVAVANQLRACVREEDTVARFAGDEFVVLLEDTSRDETHAAARRIAAAFTPLRVVIDRDTAASGHPVTIDVTASVGVTTTDEERSGDPLSGEALIRRADHAMYRAKRTGEVVAAFRLDTDGPTLQRKDRERELREGIARGELELHYQPIHDLATGRVAALEALVRWRHPQEGLLPPAAFLPLAEESGLIVPLGRWVLRAACEQVAAWRRTLHRAPAVTMSVNVSPRQLASGDAFIDDLTAVLRDTGIDPGRLVIEITETALLPDVEAPALLGEIRALGVRAALDDFGVGYSSLRSVQRLPIELLKIDRGFVGEMLRDDSSRVLVNAIVALGEALRLRVIAEGVETEEQLAALRDIGCAYGQGYLLSRPAPADAIEPLLVD